MDLKTFLSDIRGAWKCFEYYHLIRMRPERTSQGYLKCF